MVDLVTDPIFSQKPEPVTVPDFPTPNHRASEGVEPQPRNTGRFSPHARAAAKEQKEAEKTILDSVVPDKVPNRKGQFVEPVTKFYVTVALGVSPIKPGVAKVIAQNARTCAEAWDELAHENETVRRYLKGFLTVNTTGAVIMAHIPIVMAIGAEIPAFKSRIDKAFGEDDNADE